MALQEFTRFIWWMQTERRVAANTQTKPTDLDCESADKSYHPHRTDFDFRCSNLGSIPTESPPVVSSDQTRSNATEALQWKYPNTQYLGRYCKTKIS